MQKKPETKTLMAFALIVWAASAAAQTGTNTMAGTWKLNVAKSQYSLGNSPKSEIRTYSALANGQRDHTERTEANGKRIVFEYDAYYDEKDYPRRFLDPPNSGPGAGTVALKRLDANTVMATVKVPGRPTQTTRLQVAKDGKVFTSTQDGASLEGKKFHNVLVFEKQ